MPTVNRKIALAARPSGFPELSDFQLVYATLPEPAAGEVVVRSAYLSLDPYMRGRMSDTPSYAPAVAVGEMLPGGAVGIVIASRDASFQPGDAVLGMLGWQEYALARGRDLRRLDPAVAPISTALGVLGMPGLTAFFGLLDLSAPRKGETVVVSGAAGAVGMIAGQIAKLKGCRVVGVAGSDAKVSWLLEELGFDAAFNYRNGGVCFDTLAKLCPAGIDVYFDNVGGAVSDAAIRLINGNARISLCGQISQYNLEEPEMGPRWLGHLIAREAKAEGFLVSSYAEEFPRALAQLTRWLKQGKLKYREDVAQGIEAAPQAFIGMLHGRNQGKQLVQLS